jgi:uncharacterized protein (TIGR02118 family)
VRHHAAVADGEVGALRAFRAGLYACLGRRRLVFNHVLPGAPGAGPAWDGISEDWFDSAEALQAALASPAGQAVAADAPNFVDPGTVQLLVVEEEEMTSPPGPAR